MSEILKDFITHIVNLTEADRFTRETGRRFNMQQEVEKYVDVFENGIAKYAFTMTKVAKLGINPKYSWGNPRGIYAYPLTSEMFQQLKDNKLPFVSDAPYFSIFEILNTKKMLDVDVTSDDPKKKCKEIYDIALNDHNLLKRADFSETEKTFESIYNTTIRRTKYWDHSGNAKIYGFVYHLVRSILDEKEYRSKQAAVWTSLLKRVGYVGIYDKGDSILHRAEPTQLVVFDIKTIRLIKMFETAAFRKSSTPIDDEQIKSREMLANAAVTKNINIIKNFANDKNFIKRLRAAENPNTPELILDKLANDDEKSVKIAVAANPSTTSRILEKMFEQEDDTIKLKIARNKNASHRILEKMFKQGDDTFKLEIAHNKNAPDHLLQELIDENNEVFIKAISANPGASSKILDKLADNDDLEINLNIVKNKSTTSKTLLKIANKKIKNIRIQIFIARNPNTPAEVLIKMSKLPRMTRAMFFSLIDNPNLPFVQKNRLKERFKKAINKEKS